MNTDYKFLPRTIWQSLLSDDEFKIQIAGYDLHIPGTKANHLIDVYFEFIQNATPIYIAIDCGSYNTAVTLQYVETFYSKLVDLRYISGIIVTREKSESKVRESAAKKGINIVQVDNLWTGSKLQGKTITKELPFSPIIIHKRTLHPDEDWLKTNKIVLSEEETGIFSRLGFSEEIDIFDSQGKIFANIYTVDASLPIDQSAVNLHHFFDFDDGYIEFPLIGTIKLSSIEYLYDVLDLSSEIIAEGKKVEQSIINNIQGNKINFVNNALIQYEIDEIHYKIRDTLFKPVYNH